VNFHWLKFWNARRLEGIKFRVRGPLCETKIEHIVETQHLQSHLTPHCETQRGTRSVGPKSMQNVSRFGGFAKNRVPPFGSPFAYRFGSDDLGRTVGCTVGSHCGSLFGSRTIWVPRPFWKMRLVPIIEPVGSWILSSRCWIAELTTGAPTNLRNI
jgi:hypothetical protein